MTKVMQTTNDMVSISTWQGSFTSISSKQATSFIGQCQRYIQGEHENLSELEEAIAQSDIWLVSQIHIDLNQSTKNIASDTSENLATQLRQVGALLSNDKFTSIEILDTITSLTNISKDAFQSMTATSSGVMVFAVFGKSLYPTGPIAVASIFDHNKNLTILLSKDTVSSVCRPYQRGNTLN